MKRPDKISTIVPGITPICRTGGSGAAAHYDDATRIWLSSVETVANLRKREIMNANNQNMDSDLSKKYNATISDVGKFFNEGDCIRTKGKKEALSDMDSDPTEAGDEDITEGIIDALLESEDLPDADDTSINNEEDMMDFTVDDNNTIIPHGADNGSTHSLEGHQHRNGNETKTKARSRYRSRGKSSKRFGINAHATSTCTTRSSSVKHEELLPNYASREALMVDRCEVDRLTERMLKALRRNGRYFLVDMGAPSINQLDLLLKGYNGDFYGGDRTDRNKWIHARLNSHLQQHGGPSGRNASQVYGMLFTALYGNTSVNETLKTSIALSVTMPIIVASLCDIHAPNMTDSPYSIDGTTRKKRYFGNMAHSGQSSSRDPNKDGYKATNDFQTLLNFNLMSGDDYYRAIEKKRMNACKGLGGYEVGGRSFNRKAHADSARDGSKRKLDNILLVRTNEAEKKKQLMTYNEKKKRGTKRARDEVNTTGNLSQPQHDQGKINFDNDRVKEAEEERAEENTNTKKKQKSHWLNSLESSAQSKRNQEKQRTLKTNYNNNNKNNDT
jgi:hypothetical protein